MRFINIVFMACAVMSVYADMATGEIGELSSNTRCTAAAFGHSDGNLAVLPSASFQTQITNFTATKAEAQVTINFNGVAALFGADNIGQLSGANEKRSFLLIYRCDENATSGSVWSLITPTTGDLSATKYTVVQDSGTTGFEARTFTDTFEGVSSVDSKYWYLGFTLVSASDNPLFFSAISDEAILASALSAFDGANNDTAITWSEPVVTFANFQPQQDHVVLDLGNSVNFTSLSGGRKGSVASPRLTDTAIDTTVSHTLTALAEESNFITTPTYSWTWALSLNGSAVATPAGLTFTPSSNTLVIGGEFGHEDAAPGDYVLHATNVVTDGTTSSSATGMLAWKVAARQVKTDLAADSTAVAVEIGNTESFTIVRTWGFADGGVNSRKAEVDVNWTISNVSNQAVQFDKTSATGDSATFSVTFADDDNLVGAYTFDLTVAEVCKANAAPDCAGLVTTNTISYGVQALGHDFNFSNRAKESEQGDRSDSSTYVPIFHSSDQSSKPNFSSYVFQAVNMKSGFSALTTATMTIASMTRNGGNVAVTNDTASAGGVTVTADSNTASATVTADLASVTTNDKYIITVQAESSTSDPTTTSVTIAFIVLEAQKPTVITSAVIDDSTGSAFAWPDQKARSAFPALSGKDARVTATFSEEVTGPKIVISGSTPGVETAMTGSGESYSHVVTSGALQGFLGGLSTAAFTAEFSKAVDALNEVNKNTMDPALATFSVVRTPEPNADLGTPGLAPHPRNSSFTISFADVITGGTLAALRDGLTASFGDFVLTLGADSRSVTISPLPGRDLIAAGQNSTDITLAAGSVFNGSGYPNTKVGSYTGISFQADAKAPVLLAQSVDADDYLTNVTYYLTFNEGLSGAATVVVTNLTAGTSSTLNPSPKINILEVALTSLSFDSEYQVFVTVKDATNNEVTIALAPFFTLSDDAQTQAEIALVNAVDNEAPTVQNIVPDFRVAANQVNVPLRPIISVEFSEQMADSTTSSMWVSDTLGANSGVGLNLEAFDGVTLTVNPSAELNSGTKYWITFNGAKAKDLSGNSLTPVTYSFTTYSPEADTNTAPEFRGTNMVGVFKKNTAPRIYFSEPVDVSSMDSAVSIKNASSEEVDGSWILDGADVTFATTGIIAGGSYTFTLWTSRVADLLGEKDDAGEKVTGSFTVQADTAIRDFKVQAEGTGTTLNVTASFVPPVDRAGITGYTVTYEELDSNLVGDGNVEPLAVNDSVASSKIRTVGAIAGFSAGKSYRFTVTSGGVVTSATVDVLSIPSVADQFAKELVSILSKKSVKLGSDEEKGSANIPPGALEQSTEISISTAPDTNLKSKDGGGERYSEVVQYGPDGLTFKEPVEIGLRIAPDGGLSTLAASCATANSTCEADLLRALNPLVFDTQDKKWKRGGLAKGRVKALDANTGVLFARTPHFSNFVVAKAFNIVSPANNTALTAATIGEAYAGSEIELSGVPSDATVNVSFSPADLGFVADESSADNNLVEITNTQARVERPATGAGATATSVTVTVEVIDVADNNRTETRTYTIEIIDLNGDPDFVGTPNQVDFFTAVQSGPTTVDLNWSIASDGANGTTRTIHEVIISTSKVGGEATTASFTRGVTGGTSVTVEAHESYVFKVWTKSAQGKRSAAKDDIERFTFGTAQTTASNAVNPVLAQGITLDFNGVDAGETISFNGYSAAELLSLTGANGILLTSTTARVPNGTLTFFQESFIDVSFNGSVASVSYQLNRSGSLAVYHFKQTTTGGAWEELSTCTDGLILCATLEKVDADGNTQTKVTIKSKGSGSPFVVGPRVVSARRSGGGCLSVATDQTDVNPVEGVLNFLLMLLPLGFFMLRRSQ